MNDHDGSPLVANTGTEFDTDKVRDGLITDAQMPVLKVNQQLDDARDLVELAIEAGVPIVPVCVSRYARRLSLNSWRQRTVIVRSLPPIATTGMTPQDLPALIEQCRGQMQQCIDRMEKELA